MRSRSFVSPRSGSCCEGYAIQAELSGQTLTAPQQQQGLCLVPGKVKPFNRLPILAYSSRILSKRPGPPQSACRRGAGVKKDPLVRAQAQGQPDRASTVPPARSAALQPADRAGLSAQGGLPTVLGLRVAELRWQVPW